jgi:predicted deacylase
LNHATLIERLRNSAPPGSYFEYGEVLEGGRSYPLPGVITRGRHELVITSGFHGEEPAGPITLATYLSEILEYARARDVGLRIYPCINPSGFEARTRYNASGERPNNDLLRYEIVPGEWKDTLGEGETFLRWSVYPGGPKETRALREELERHPAPDAALDIHQDHHVQGQLTYAYVFGPRNKYLPLMEASSKLVEVAKSFPVDVRIRTDPDGLIEFHDGSVTDYFERRGSRFTAALETTTRTPLDAAMRVNLVWIEGFIRLAAEQ